MGSKMESLTRKRNNTRNKTEKYKTYINNKKIKRKLENKIIFNILWHLEINFPFQTLLIH